MQRAGPGATRRRPGGDAWRTRPVRDRVARSDVTDWTLVILAGEQVRPDGVRLLATMLGDDALATRLVGALDTDTTIFALSDGQRECILVALGEAPPGALVGLHSALLRQRELRVRRAKSQERVHKMQLRQGRAS